MLFQIVINELEVKSLLTKLADDTKIDGMVNNDEDRGCQTEWSGLLSQLGPYNYVVFFSIVKCKVVHWRTRRTGYNSKIGDWILENSNSEEDMWVGADRQLITGSPCDVG